MEKNNNKNYDIKAIVSEDNKLEALVVNGKKYKLRNSETKKDLSRRIALKKGNGVLFLDTLEASKVKGYTKDQYRRHVKSIHPARKSLKTKIVSAAVAGVMAMTGIAATYGPSFVKAYKADKNAYATEQTQYQINESNKALKNIYEKLMQTKNGATIVKQLQETDKFQEEYNQKIAKYPDAEGNVLFLKAREVSAIQDISNAKDTSFISLDYDETRFCDYLEGAEQTTKGMYVSENPTGEHTLIHNKTTKKEMKKEEDFAQKAIKGNATTQEIDKHFDELQETGLTYGAPGVNVAYMGEGSNIVLSQNGASSKKLDNFIEKVKTNNDGANQLDSYADSKIDLTDDQRMLVDEAWDEMDKQNIKVDLKSRDKFDMTTTEKGKSIHNSIIKVTGGYLSSNGDGTYTYTTKKGTTKKVSKKEAMQKFGKETVQKAEEKADEKAGITEKNNKEEQKKEELEKEAYNYEQDYAQGQTDGYAGVAKRKNTPGYNAGYANGQKRKVAEQEPDEIIKDEVTKETTYDVPTPTESTEQTEQTTRQTVKEIETYNVEPTVNETSYKSTARVRA